MEPEPVELVAACLRADAAVDLAEARRESGLDEVLAKLDSELVGLNPVNTRIAEIAALLLIRPNACPLRHHRAAAHAAHVLHRQPAYRQDDSRAADGRPAAPTGLPATRPSGQLTRDDLVGEYIGHTAPKTKEVVKWAMGGVLFIDEAYYLYKVENERDYGSEAIEILLQVMENNRDDLAVILAGYADKMDKFFSANPGVQSRIAHHITFPDYTVGELEQIAVLMSGQLGYSLSADARAALRRYLHRRIQQPWFANARSVRNAMERARLRHARRLLTGTNLLVDLAALTTIEAPDLLASRVFDDTRAAEERR